MESLDAEVRRSRYTVCRLILACLRLIDKTRVHSGQLTNNEMITSRSLSALSNWRQSCPTQEALDGIFGADPCGAGGSGFGPLILAFVLRSSGGPGCFSDLLLFR